MTKNIMQSAWICQEFLRFFATVSQPVKIAWLLEHQYSPAELSFSTLKNADAAHAKLLFEAASLAHCAIHLGIVHIEESGSAEPHYSRWDRHPTTFDIVDVCAKEQYIDEWIDPQNLPVPLGKIPLREGEVFPPDALDGVDPDEERLLEETGNEGASYERSYHCAALVLWKRNRHINVLLQSGIPEAASHFRECCMANVPPEELQALAVSLLTHWEMVSRKNSSWKTDLAPQRSMMINLLVDLKQPELLEAFVVKVLLLTYDGSENGALYTALPLISPTVLEQFFIANMASFPDSCVRLFS
jgi:hypothetical protein